MSIERKVNYFKELLKKEIVEAIWTGMGDNALGCTMIKEDVTIAQDHFHKQEYFVKCVD